MKVFAPSWLKQGKRRNSPGRGQQEQIPIAAHAGFK
jgi:hypothetical protein